MVIRNHQLKELNEARRLQDKLCQLHVPSPVLSWKYEILDENGKVIEKGTGKSNSFTRNALNILAWYLGMVDFNIATNATVFADGYVNRKDVAGTLVAFNGVSYGGRSSTAGVNPAVMVGTSNAAESLDSYALPSSGLTGSGTSVGSQFNATRRVLTTIMSCGFTNNTASSIDITESGVYIAQNSTTGLLLMIRDVFAARTVAPGKTLIWTYVTEVAYPEP